MTTSARTATELIGPQAFVREREFRRLLLTRFSAHWGNGMYQAGLAGAVLVAVSVAATVVPDDGRSPALLIAATVLYLVGAAGYVFAVRRHRTA